MFDFEKLHVYRKAKDLNALVYNYITTHEPERFARAQLRRAALSVPCNIAEGSGKFSRKDRRNFFVIARASLFECIALCDILNDEKSINQETFSQVKSLADELSRMLFRMIKNLETTDTE